MWCQSQANGKVWLGPYQRCERKGCELTNVSVCMAAYNGSEFIIPQIESILTQLTPDDELIIIDDYSKDNTADLVAGLGDLRIKLIRHETNQGYVKTFQEGLNLAQGDYVFIADQDDIWLEGRVAAMCAELEKVQVVATNLSVIGREGGLIGPYGQNDWRLRAADSTHHLRNIIGIYAGNRPYYGSAMAMRREALQTILPFARYMNEQYDLWIGIYANLARSISHLEIRSVAHRYHGANDTPDRPRFPLLLWTRTRLLIVTAQLGARILRNRRPKVNFPVQPISVLEPDK